MSYDTIRFDASDGIVQITLNRPDRANSMNRQLGADLLHALHAVEDNPEFRVVILTGAGKHFCAGADLREARAPQDMAAPRDDRNNAVDFLQFCRVPVIAAINGTALGGGCEMALASDFRVMADSAKIGLPEIRFGSLPGGGGTQRLPRLVGVAVAREMIMLGEPRTAEEALRIGLVNKVVPSDELLSECNKWARSLAEKPAFALKSAKQLIDKGIEMPLRDALNFERQTIGSMATLEERQAARDRAASTQDAYARIWRKT
jgi:enoyl-CoA hydratase/carnithine racemase